MKTNVWIALDGFITRTTNLAVGRRFFLVLLGSGAMATGQPVSATDCVPPPSGLVSWWRAEQDAADALGSNSGQALNGVRYTNGLVGAAFYFDGVDDRVIVSNSASLNFGPGADFSIEAWIKPEVAITDFGVQSIVNKRYTPDSFAAVGWEFGLIDGKLACQLADAPLTPGDFSTFVSAGPDLRDGTFHHVALVLQRDSATGGKLLVDGQVVLTFDPTVQPGDLGSTEPLRIGAHADAALNSHFTGAVDEVSIYNRALTAAEILSIFNSGSAGKCPPPPATSEHLIDVDLGYGNSSSKVGFAATGQTAADYWNFYTRDDGFGGYRTFGAVSNLKFANGAVSSVGLTVANAPGAWGNGSSDAMYQINVYPFDGGNITVTVTDLPPGQYDFYLYNQEGNYQVTVGGTDYGIKTTSDPANTSPPVWQEGKQYAVFRNVSVASVGQAVTITVRPGVGGLALISGMQIATVSTAPPPCVPAPSGLVSWWRAESNALDSADGNNGTLQNGATIVAGKVGQAFSLDGVDDVVTVPDAPNLRFGPTSPMTVDMWVYRTSSNPVQHMIGKRTSCTGSPTEGTFQLFLDMNTGAGLGFGGPSDTCACSGQDLPLNTWTYLAGTFDGTTLRLFINGQLAAITPGSLGPANTAPLKIGDSGSCGAAYGAAFGGLIDEVSIYNRALSANEIAGIYSAGGAGKCAATNPPAYLVNVNFGAHLNPNSLSAIKVGLAATGATTNDFWNFYSRDGTSAFDWLVNGALPNLKLADGTPTTAGLVVNNAPGCWSDDSSDAMYNSYIYPFDGGNATVTVTNLPAGQFDIYVYSPDGNYQLVVGGADRGTKTTQDAPLVNPPVWQEGRQYALFKSVTVNAGEAVTVTVRPGISGYATISGMQIAAAAGSIAIPAAPTGLTVTAGYGQVALSWNASSGATNYSVKRSLESGGSYNTITAGAGLSFVDTGLNNGVTYYYVVSAVGAGGESTNSTPVNATPSSSSFSLMNIDFGYGTSSSKVGFAATGQTANDFWNFYTRDDGFGGYRTFGAVSNLKFANGTISSVGLTVANAPGAWGNGSSDAMYQKSVYPFGGGNITVTVTNLPIGRYDFYLYNQEGNYQVTVGGTDYGIKTTSDPANTSPPVWQEGKQYAVFRNVSVASVGQAVTITVRPGVGGLALISGMQIAAVSNASPPACVPAPSGLAHWWPGESNATDVVDGASGTLQNGATFAAGKAGQAFSFDGVDDSVSFGNTTGNFGTNDFAIEFWIKNTATTYASVIEKWPTCGLSSMWGIRIRGPGPWGAAGRVEAFMISDAAGNDANSIFSGRVINDGVFHHVAVVRQATNLLLYIDGTFEVQGSTPGITRISNTANLVAGRSVCTGIDGTQPLAGQLDEISIYGRALSSGEIQSIYNAGSAGKCPPAPPAVAPFTNGSFELPALVAGSGLSLAPGSTAITGWTVGSVVGMGWQNGASFGVNPVDGVQHIGFNGGNAAPGSYIFQTFSTTVGQTYAVSFYVGRNGSGTGTMSLLATVNSSTAAVLGSLNAVAPVSPSYGPVQTFPFTATTTTSTLTFTDTSSATVGVDSLLDNVSVTPVTQCVPAPSGLVSWWRAENNAQDSVDGNHGSLVGSVSFGGGEVGQAFNFDGTGEVVVPSTASLNVHSVTFEAWVNPSVVDSDVDTILNKENDPALAAADISYEIGIRGAVNAGVGSIPVGHLAFFLGGLTGLPDEYGGGWIDGGAAVPTNQWSHCALAFDGTAVRVYVNGMLTRTIAGLSGTMNSTTGPFKIGSRSTSLVSGRPELRFNGFIDEVSVYNRALSAIEIQAIFNAGTAGKCGSGNPIAMPDTLATAMNTPVNLSASKLLQNDSDPEGNPLTITGVSSSSLSGGTASLAAGRITYAPALGFQGNDRFTYSISNGHGGTAIGTVTATVGTGGQVRLNISYGPVIEGGEFVVRFAGIPGLHYTIEAAPGISGPWTKVADQTAPATNEGFGVGVFEFRESVASYESRFYRTIYPPY